MRQNDKNKVKMCKHCLCEFEHKRSDAEFCSNKCWIAHKRFRKSGRKNCCVMIKTPRTKMKFFVSELAQIFIREEDASDFSLIYENNGSQGADSEI